MYSVIFVDDEKYFLNKVPSAIAWNENGFELTATFSRSEKVMEYLEQNAVDVLITDIKMPNVSGLELAKICSERFPSIIVVILSAYQDFKYAQEAMKYGAFDYLTKPLNYQDISQTLRRIKAALDARETTRFFAGTKDRLVLQQLFNDMVYGSVSSADEIRETLQKNNLFIDPYKSACKILTIHIFDFANYINRSWKHPLDRLYNAVNSLIPYETAQFIALAYRYFMNYIEFFVISKGKTQRFDSDSKELVAALKNNLKETLNLDCDILLTEEYASLQALIENKKQIKADEVHFENEIIQKADEYIKTHYNESITLKEAAAHVNLSYKYFGNYFKRHTGFNFINYLNLYRLKKAVELMTDSALTVTEICERTGFGNQTFFYNLFRQNYGMSPAQYRKMILKGNGAK